MQKSAKKVFSFIFDLFSMFSFFYKQKLKHESKENIFKMFTNKRSKKKNCISFKLLWKKQKFIK